MPGRTDISGPTTALRRQQQGCLKGRLGEGTPAEKLPPTNQTNVRRLGEGSSRPQHHHPLLLVSNPSLRRLRATYCKMVSSVPFPGISMGCGFLCVGVPYRTLAPQPFWTVSRLVLVAPRMSKPSSFLFFYIYARQPYILPMTNPKVFFADVHRNRLRPRKLHLLPRWPKLPGRVRDEGGREWRD